MNIHKVGVIGCGLMGAGIAQVAAQAGYPTIVRELNAELLERGLGHIRTFLDKGVEKKKLTQEARDSTWTMIHGTTELADLAECDLVIEAVFEDMQTKKELFERLDSICHKEAILTSNTSSLSITEMASITQRPERSAGLHYFYPSVINQLLEIVATDQTTPEVIRALLVFARTTGKVPIVVKDAPGFAVNRFFVPWLNEAVHLLDEGFANIPTIDAAACARFGIGMGPFALMNATGVPIAFHAASSLAQSLGAFYAPADGLKTQVEAGEGWDLGGDVDETVMDMVAERLIGVVFGVAVQLAEEGVAEPEDIDRGALVGLRWAQGPFGMMNDLGLGRALELSEQVVARRETFFIPELMRQQAVRGQGWDLRDVRLKIEDRIATITMSRPEAMNALNEKVLCELKEALAQVRENEVVRAVIITGEGPAFVAGADIRAMLEKRAGEIKAFTRLGQQVLSEIESMEKPVIAAINGFALGGGLELALACDIRLASDQAQMGFPEVGLGIFPGFGGTQRATRLIGKGQASELIFTGDPVSADTALSLGLVNRVLPPHQLLPVAHQLAERIATRGPLALAGAKRAINQALESGLDAGLAFELKEVLKTFNTQDQKEGMQAFLERRAPDFKGQ